MKTAAKLLAVIFISVGTAFAQEPSPVKPADAETLYREGNFQQAVEAYRKTAAERPADPYAHYNLGNALFKSGAAGRAIASYYRAFLLLPRNGDIRFNLAFAMKSAGQSLVPQGMPEAVHRIFYFLSYNELKGLLWLALWVLCLSLSAYIYGRKNSTALKKILWVSAALLCVSGLWTGLRRAADLQNPAVIVQGTAELRTGPGDNFSAAATIPEGHLVDIMEERDSWAEVGIPEDGIKGWLKKESLEAVKTGLGDK